MLTEAVMQIPGLNISELQFKNITLFVNVSSLGLAICSYPYMHLGSIMDKLMSAFILGLSWSQLDRTGRIDGQLWGKVLCSSRGGKHQPSSLLCHVCLTPFSQWRQWFSSLNAWKHHSMWSASVCVYVSERSVCPQEHACFHLQVNINNTFCHQGMFAMAQGWREFNAAAAALLGKAAGQHFTTCHHSLPKRHLATNLQSCCCPF